MTEPRVEIDPSIKKWLQDEAYDSFRSHFLQLHPYDQARLFVQLSEEERVTFYSFLSPEEMALLIEHVDEETDFLQSIMNEMETAYAASIFEHMYTDDAVDVLQELDDKLVTSFLTTMDDNVAEDLQDLLHYDQYTAGSIMTTEYIAIFSQQTAKSAMNILKKEAPEAETIYYVYVVDDFNQLVGVVSLRDLIVHDEDTFIKDMMYNNVESVFVGEDQEEVARKMKDYDFLALPVVDSKKRLLGIITVDDILDVVDEEATDDYSKFAGVSDVDQVDQNPFIAAKQRLPWLIILLFLGLFTANLIGNFEETLNKVTVLAVFIPLIAGMAGNSGTQALAVAVRGLATGNFAEEGVTKLIFREAGTGLVTGGTCGVVVTFVVALWQGSWVLGLLVGSAIFCSLFVATLAGSLVPLVMHKLKIDPAVASGPFITTINDVISILIYLGLATTFMGYL
ncbi:magnesium transporter [Bacillus fonticola]|uniref:magnesium transporter n=1 Tax=Bacillus fonticola TaxID=2728853 RepID=UPI0014736AB6|nr:magnesium transporter [Bacillus fonticola]